MKQHEQASHRYEKLFIRFSVQIESILKKMLISLFVLLLIFQFLLHNRYTASFVSSVIRLEGTPVPAVFTVPNTEDEA